MSFQVIAAEVEAVPIPTIAGQADLMAVVIKNEVHTIPGDVFRTFYAESAKPKTEPPVEDLVKRQRSRFSITPRAQQQPKAALVVGKRPPVRTVPGSTSVAGIILQSLRDGKHLHADEILKYVNDVRDGGISKPTISTNLSKLRKDRFVAKGDDGRWGRA